MVSPHVLPPRLPPQMGRRASKIHKQLPSPRESSAKGQNVRFRRLHGTGLLSVRPHGLLTAKKTDHIIDRTGARGNRVYIESDVFGVASALLGGRGCQTTMDMYVCRTHTTRKGGTRFLQTHHCPLDALQHTRRIPRRSTREKTWYCVDADSHHSCSCSVE